MAKKPTKKQQKEISEGVKSMVREYEDTGEIKTSRATYHPENKRKAVKQALAIEYGEHHINSRSEHNKRKSK